MNKYPPLIDLAKAFICDCYNYLEQNADETTKLSINNLINMTKSSDKIIQKLYVVYCSIEPTKRNDIDIIYLAQAYIIAFYQYINNDNSIVMKLPDELRISNDFVKQWVYMDFNNHQIISKDIDCCLIYLALIGYKKKFDGAQEYELFSFYCKNYENFNSILNTYGIVNNAANIFNDNIDFLVYKKGNNNYCLTDLIKIFQINSTIKINGFFQTDKDLNISKEINELKNSLTQLESTANLLLENNKKLLSETKFMINFIQPQKETNSPFKDKTELENRNKQLKDNNKSLYYEMKILEESQKILEFKIDIRFDLSIIKSEINHLDILENFITSSELSSIEISIEGKKLEFLQNNVDSLKNTITNLFNPFNLNLWRKISCIILKNIFVILKNEKYNICQKVDKSLFFQIKELSENKKYSSINGLKEKVNNYENKIKIKGNEDIKIFGSPDIDQERGFNLITILKNDKYDINSSLSIEFLFYLNEIGYMSSQFSEKMSDIILFEDMNMNKLDDKKSDYYEEEKENEYKNKNQIINKQYEGKIKFKGEEIIDMLKNPKNYYKRNIDLNEMFEPTLGKINEFEAKYKNNKKDFKKLLKDSENLFKKIKKLKASCENFFETNKIDYKNKNKIQNEKEDDNDINDILKIYSETKVFETKINEKISYYKGMDKKLEEIYSTKSYETEKIDKLISDNIKNMESEEEILTIDNIFNKFKEELKEKIGKNQYKDYAEIFNEENITKFNINDFYSFLRRHLDNYEFSIIKRDVINLNLLIEIIMNFNELIDVYSNDLDIKIDSY